ncbi:MAG TPA: hypothetical protein VFJ70_09525, partial [Burkholderiales bacterium]|nr:hypothetical protein [Burkholderiales bacterium]
LMALGIQHASAHHLAKACPSGTAVQGVDFYRHQLVCVPVGGGSDALKVMDANNQEVGVLDGYGSLARLVNNEWVQLIFTENGFNGNAFAVYYESADCTGPAYIPDFNQGFMPKIVGVTVNGTSATLYSAVPGTFAPRTVLSFQNVSSTGFDPLCQPTDGSAQTVGVPQTTTISNNPPFRISQ